MAIVGNISITWDKKKGLVYLTDASPPPIEGERKVHIFNANDLFLAVKVVQED